MKNISEKKQQQRPFSATLSRLWHHLGPHRKLYVIGMSFGFLDAMFQTSVPLFFRYVLNGIQADPSVFMSHKLWPSILIGIAVTVGFFPAAYLFHVFISIAMARFGRHMRISLYEHVSRLSADFFQRNHVGEITARMNNDLDVVTGSMGMFMGTVWGIVVLMQALIMMYWINVPLALIMTVMVFSVFQYTRLYLPKIRAMSRKIRDAIGEVSATVTEYISIHDLIRSYSREDFVDEKVDKSSEQAQKQAEYYTWRQNAFLDVMQVLVTFVAPMTLLFVGAWMLAGGIGGLRVGDLVAAWGYWILLGTSVRAISSTFAQIFAGFASADRIFDFFDETPMVKDEPNAPPLAHVKGEITFDGVTFRYPIASNNVVLDDFSMVIPAGKRVALVGPSGAGKSTILQLILRFYDPQSGGIRIDGKDIRTVRQASLRDSIGIVMQDSVFFSGSIAENLRLGDEQATTAQMREALSHANALEFVEEMDGGLDALLGERGLRLSGGQKQRLSIARVFLKDPPILLFDEATSSLDSVSEKLVQEAMERLMNNRTSIVVAHRISTIVNADTIFVISEGRIQASGRHEFLFETDPLYRQLCLQQGLAIESA